ncbi:hypothetical protein A3K73_02590 [Candidatus Pacearchaeota archaeon RBG_13_36_9]|nr:MAG: hypothetical protein A3K73_02590 [Candidatus Pacearchaeota archaeon RBG_13_36_9]
MAYKKLFNSELLMPSMIKLLILDQDGTLYKNKRLLNKIRENTHEFFCKKLSIDKENYSRWYSKNKKDFPNIFEALKKFNISIEEYHSQVFDIVKPESYLKKDRPLFKVLKMLGLPIYVVTSSSKNYSKKVLKSLGIYGLIKDSISLSKERNDKIKIYNEIIKSERVNPEEACVIGDNWETDLKEAKKQRFRTILIGRKNQKPFFIKSMKGLLAVIECFNKSSVKF